jgi:uncharacterized protein with PIN domain
MKVLCDQMLGSLARWLRLFGFDTFYANSEMEDEELLKIAKKEDRVIITRDKQLIARGKKEKLSVIEVNTTDLDEQLNLVLKNVDIDQKAILSRCSVCNTILDEVKKSEVKGKVPAKIFERNEKFWFCEKCDKFYWMGSHYDKIINKIDEVKKLQNG